MRPTATPRMLAALVCAALAGCAAVGHTHPQPADAYSVSPAQWASLKAQAERVPALEATVGALSARLETLEARLDPVEQRAGLTHFHSDRLAALDGTQRGVVLPEATQVGGPLDKPIKRSLARHVSTFDGYVISFWATWCVPCISDEELVRLRQLQARLARKNIELISMAIDDLDKVLAHPKAPRWLYPLWQRDDGHLDIMPRGLVETVGVNLPLFLVVSRDGEVCQYYNRKLDDEAVRDIVTAAGPSCPQE